MELHYKLLLIFFPTTSLINSFHMNSYNSIGCEARELFLGLIKSFHSVFSVCVLLFDVIPNFTDHKISAGSTV